MSKFLSVDDVQVLSIMCSMSLLAADADLLQCRDSSLSSAFSSSFVVVVVVSS